MKNVLAILGAVFVLLVLGLFALCDDDEDSLGRIQLVSHEYDDGGYYDDGEGGGNQSYDGQWSNEDRNRNRGRDRGAFSPGPFTDSPVTITICAVPDSCPQNPPEEETPQ